MAEESLATRGVYWSSKKLDTIRVLRGDDKSDMMPFVQTPDDLWFLDAVGIGVFLAGKCDDDACVVLLRLRQLVGLVQGLSQFWPTRARG